MHIRWEDLSWNLFPQRGSTRPAQPCEAFLVLPSPAKPGLSCPAL